MFVLTNGAVRHFLQKKKKIPTRLNVDLMFIILLYIHNDCMKQVNIWIVYCSKRPYLKVQESTASVLSRIKMSFHFFVTHTENE